MRTCSHMKTVNQSSRSCPALVFIAGLAVFVFDGATLGVSMQPVRTSPSSPTAPATSPPYGEHSTVRPPAAPPAPVIPDYPIRFPGFEPGQPYLISGHSGGFFGGTVVVFGSRSSDFQRHFRDWYWGSHFRRSELRRFNREQGYSFYYGSIGNLFWDNQPIQGRMGSDFWNLDLDQMTVRVASDPGSSKFTIDPNLLPPAAQLPAGQTQGTVTPLTQLAAATPLLKQVELLIAGQRETEAAAMLTAALAADEGIYSPALLHMFRGYLRLSMKQYDLGAADLLAAVTLDATAVFVSPPGWLKTLRSDNWQTIADELPTKARRSAGGQAAAALRFSSALLYGHFGELDRADRQLREAEAAGLGAPLAEAMRKLIGPAKATP